MCINIEPDLKFVGEARDVDEGLGLIRCLSPQVNLARFTWLVHWIKMTR